MLLTVHHRDGHLDVRGELVPVDCQPAVGDEPKLGACLNVVDNDGHEEPGLHFSDPAVVVPYLDVVEMTEGPKILNVIFFWLSVGSRISPHVRP